MSILPLSRCVTAGDKYGIRYHNLKFLQERRQPSAHRGHEFPRPSLRLPIRGRALWYGASDGLRNDKRRAVSPAQKPVGFFVANDLLFVRIEAKRATEAIRRIRQMQQGAREVPLLDRGTNVLRAAAANAINEIGEVVCVRFPGRAWLDVRGEPGLVGIVAVDAQVTLRTEEDVSDGIGLRIHDTGDRLSVLPHSLRRSR